MSELSETEISEILQKKEGRGKAEKLKQALQNINASAREGAYQMPPKKDNNISKDAMKGSKKEKTLVVVAQSNKSASRWWKS